MRNKDAKEENKGPEGPHVLSIINKSNNDDDDNHHHNEWKSNIEEKKMFDVNTNLRIQCVATKAIL